MAARYSAPGKDASREAPPPAPTPAARRDAAASLLGLTPRGAVLQLALPTTIVMAVAAVSNVSYTWFVSRLGVDAIAAVSLVFPISLLAVTVMGGGIGSGSAAAVARALGGGRRELAAASAGHALVLSVLIGAAFGLLVVPLAPQLFALMGARGRVLDDAVTFARIVFGGAFVTFVGGMFDSVLRGEGNARVPAIWATTSLALQIVVTPLLMFGAGWGLPGAALAMILCQGLATLPRAWFVFSGRGVVRPALPRHVGFAPTRDILRVGLPAALSTSIAYLGTLILTGVVARIGEPQLAAFGLGTRLDFVLLSFAFGFGSAVLTLVGLAVGAGRPEQASRYVRAAGVFTVAILGAGGVALAIWPRLWLGLFTHDAAVLEAGAAYFAVVGPSYPFLGVSMVLAFAFQGLGRATAPMVLMAVRVALVLTGAIVVTRGLGMGAGAVFVVIAAGNVLSSLMLLALWQRRGPRAAVPRP